MIKKMKRQFNVAHSKDGWSLRVEDEHIVFRAAEQGIEWTLDLLRHPCCSPPNGSAFWWWLPDFVHGCLFHYYNLPGKLHYLNKYVGSIPLSYEQVKLVANDPEWVEEWENYVDD